MDASSSRFPVLPVEFVGGGVQPVKRPIKDGRTAEQNERNTAYGQKYRAKRKAKRLEGLPGADGLDLRSSAGIRFKQEHNIPPARVKKKPKTTRALRGPDGDTTALFSMDEIPENQPLQFDYFKPPSMPHNPTHLPPFDQPSEHSLLEMNPPLGADANATRTSPPSSGGLPPTAVESWHQDGSSLIFPSSLPTHGIPNPADHSPPPPIRSPPPPIRSPPPPIHSPKPTTPMAAFSPRPPAHRTLSVNPPSPSPINPPTPSIKCTSTLAAWAGSPGSDLSSLPSSPVNSNATIEQPAGTLPIVDPHTKDFAAAVIGVELSPETPSLRWPTGFKTAVPFIPDPTDRKKNRLALDAEAVRSFSARSTAEPPAFITYLDNRLFTSTALQTRIRAELAKGNTVVVKHAREPKAYLFSEENIISTKCLNEHKSYSIHDSLLRLVEFERPQVDGSLSDFFDTIPNHNQINFVLDVPSGVTKSPDIVYPLDDGFAARTSLGDIFADDPVVLKDVYLARNWDLFHGAGVYTFEHHDAGGYITFILVESGCKMWGVIQPAGYTEAQTRAELDALNGLFIRPDFDELPESWDLPWVKNGGQLFAIPATPGDLIFMAPGAWHLVYTPVRTVATGGHIYTYNTMHLTEMSRMFDNQHALEVTNTSHISAFNTLCLMTINLIRLDKLAMNRKPLAALCRMIILHEKYIPNTRDHDPTTRVSKGGPKLHNTQTQLAKIIAEYLNIFFRLEMESGDYLFEGKTWMDPGPVVDLTQALVEWNGTPLRPHYPGGAPAGVTISDIIKRKWKPKSLEMQPTSRPSGRRTRS